MGYAGKQNILINTSIIHKFLQDDYAGCNLNLHYYYFKLKLKNDVTLLLVQMYAY